MRAGIEADIPKDSSPGYPWVEYGHDNGAVLDGYGTFVWQQVVASFNAAIRHGDNVFKMTPVELVKNGICDPVKVFIKEEPHSTKKVLAGKWRLISSVSLQEQIKTRLLCNRQNKAEIANWEVCASAAGMGLDDYGLSVLTATWKQFLEVGKPSETDVENWDWTMPYWELLADAERRIALARADKGSVFAFLMKVQAYCVANSVFVLPDGRMFAQILMGGQQSGHGNTSSTNCAARIIATLRARQLAKKPLLINGKLEIKAMGDDTVEVTGANGNKVRLTLDELLRGLEASGHKVKMVKANDRIAGLNFCSHVWREDGTAYPERPVKTLYRLLARKHSDPTYPELRAQLLWFLRHSASDLRTQFGALVDARVARAQIILHGNSGTASAKTQTSTAPALNSAGAADARTQC